MRNLLTLVALFFTLHYCPKNVIFCTVLGKFSLFWFVIFILFCFSLFCFFSYLIFSFRGGAREGERGAVSGDGTGLGKK